MGPKKTKSYDCSFESRLLSLTELECVQPCGRLRLFFQTDQLQSGLSDFRTYSEVDDGLQQAIEEVEGQSEGKSLKSVWWGDAGCEEDKTQCTAVIHNTLTRMYLLPADYQL